jgi:quercetin dioxygenase-like cupin family protein
VKTETIRQSTITRREMSSSLAVALVAFFSRGSSTLLQAQGAPAQPAAGQGSNAASAPLQTLMKEPLAEIPNAEVTVITLTVAPGDSSPAHQHTGPVFAYILEGEIENQVEPNPPKTYKAGDYFYEPPMHVHRTFRNPSSTVAAKILIFEVGEHGKPFTVGAK